GRGAGAAAARACHRPGRGTSPGPASSSASGGDLPAAGQALRAMNMPVFLAGSVTLDGYGLGDLYLLDGAEVRLAGVVQRRGPGELIDVVDGRGVRLRCRIVEVRTADVHLEIDARVEEPAPAVRLVLVQALAKGDRDELAIETATE